MSRSRKKNAQKSTPRKDDAKVTMTKNGSVQLHLLTPDSNPPSVRFEEPAVKPAEPTLWVALVKAFYKTFLFGSFLKLLHDSLMFVSPMLLK